MTKNALSGRSFKCTNCGLSTDIETLRRKNYVCPYCGEVVLVDEKEQLYDPIIVKDFVKDNNAYISKCNFVLGLKLGTASCLTKSGVVDRFKKHEEEGFKYLSEKSKDGWIKLAIVNYLSLIMQEIKRHNYSFDNSKLFFDKLGSEMCVFLLGNQDDMITVLEAFQFYAPGKKQLEILGTDASRDIEKLFDCVGSLIKLVYPKTVYPRYIAYKNALEAKQSGRIQRGKDREEYVDPLINDQAESEQRDLEGTSKDVESMKDIRIKQTDKDANALESINRNMKEITGKQQHLVSLKEELENTYEFSKECRELLSSKKLTNTKIEDLESQLFEIKDLINNQKEEMTAEMKEMLKDLKNNVKYIREKTDDISQDSKEMLKKQDKLQASIDKVLEKEEKMLDKLSSEALAQISSLNIPKDDGKFDEIKELISQLKDNQEANKLALITSLNDAASTLLANTNALTKKQCTLAQSMHDVFAQELRKYSISLDYSKAPLKDVLKCQIAQKDYVGARLRLRILIENYFRIKTGYEIGEASMFTLENIPVEYQRQDKTDPTVYFVDNQGKLNYLNDTFNLGLEQRTISALVNVYKMGQKPIHGSSLVRDIDKSALDSNKDISFDIDIILKHIGDTPDIWDDEKKLRMMKGAYEQVYNQVTDARIKNNLKKTIEEIDLALK